MPSRAARRRTGPAVEGPLFGVCTHGRHDACCAERGRPVAAALTASHPAETWEISHMGGDRFAANMVVLPEGLYYGRMDPGSASQVAWLHEEGRVDLDRLRGRSSYPMHVQYAEIALRRHLEEDRLDAVRLLKRQGRTCVFAQAASTGSREWAVTVSRVRTARPSSPAAWSGSARFRCTTWSRSSRSEAAERPHLRQLPMSRRRLSTGIESSIQPRR